MVLKFMGKKRGMTQRFDKTGNVVACSVIEANPQVIIQIKRREKDGYEALQLGFEKLEAKDGRTLQRRVGKARSGHFKKAKADAFRYLSETKVENTEKYEAGQQVDLSLFEGISHVDVIGVSKGKGFQGVIKRYNFSGGPGAHGSGFHRHGGSTGMRSTPGRCLPGTKKAGRMGGERVTVQSLRVVGVDLKRHLLIVEGAIPGPRGGLVYFIPAKKMQVKKKG